MVRDGLEHAKRLADLEAQVTQLRVRLESPREPITVPVETLGPGTLRLVKPFHVVVEPADDEYVATFYDADLSATGETKEEAVYNLKDIIVATFEILSEEDPSKLGPIPRRQLSVLNEFLERTPNNGRHQ